MGGTSTAVLDTFYAFYTPGAAPRRVVGGLGWEVVSRLTQDGAAFERPNTYGAGTGVTYDPEALKVVWEALAAEAGVDLLLHAWATGVRVQDGRVEAIRTWSKGGERWFAGGALVDASGDADVCAMAGAGYDDARTTPATQSLSTLFKLANVDVARASAVPKAVLWELMREAATTGDYRLPRLEGSWHRTPHPGVVMVHMTRIPHVDATDPVALTHAEIEGRRQVREYHRFLRDRVPGLRAGRRRGHIAGHRGAREPPRPRRLPADPRGRPRRAPLPRRDRPVRRADRGSRRRGRHDLAVRRGGRRVRHPVSHAAAGRRSTASSWRDAASRRRTMPMPRRGRWPPAWRWARRPAPRPRWRRPAGRRPERSRRPTSGHGWPADGALLEPADAVAADGMTAIDQRALHRPDVPHHRLDGDGRLGRAGHRGGGRLGLRRLAHAGARRGAGRRDHGRRRAGRRVHGGPHGARRRSRRRSPPALERAGRLDAVYSAAGISGRRFGDGPLDAATLEGWETVMRTNATSQFLVCRAADPAHADPGTRRGRRPRRRADDVEHARHAPRAARTSRPTPMRPARAPSRPSPAPRRRSTRPRASASTPSRPPSSRRR